MICEFSGCRASGFSLLHIHCSLGEALVPHKDGILRERDRLNAEVNELNRRLQLLRVYVDEVEKKRSETETKNLELYKLLDVSQVFLVGWKVSNALTCRPPQPERSKSSEPLTSWRSSSPQFFRSETTLSFNRNSVGLRWERSRPKETNNKASIHSARAYKHCAINWRRKSVVSKFETKAWTASWWQPRES